MKKYILSSLLALPLLLGSFSAVAAWGPWLPAGVAGYGYCKYVRYNVVNGKYVGQQVMVKKQLVCSYKP